MSKVRAAEEILGKLHDAVANDLLRKVQSGEATAQELQAAIKFLKDNGIEAGKTEDTDRLSKIANIVLPQFTSEAEDEWSN